VRVRFALAVIACSLALPLPALAQTTAPRPEPTEPDPSSPPEPAPVLPQAEAEPEPIPPELTTPPATLERPTGTMPRTPPEPPPSSGAKLMRPIGFAMMGGGTIAIAAGVLFGLRAISVKRDAGCDGTDCSRAPPGSGDTLRQAQNNATASTICMLSGALLAVTGGALFVLSPSVSASAQVATSGAQVSLEKTF
jgi:hypothetical protein